LPDEFHLWQAELLSQTFRPPQYAAEQIFVASDLNLYYDPLNTGWYKRPDWFAVVLGYIKDKTSELCPGKKGQTSCRYRTPLPGTQDEDLGEESPREAT